MIRFALRCDADHLFESWFRSGEEFDRLRAEGRVRCEACGSTDISKAPMAPRIAGDGAATDAAARLRRKIEAEAEYVGRDFAAQARAIHEGDAPVRPIWGEARGTDIRALIEDEIPVAPLPFVPRRKMN